MVTLRSRAAPQRSPLKEKTNTTRKNASAQNGRKKAEKTKATPAQDTTRSDAALDDGKASRLTPSPRNMDAPQSQMEIRSSPPQPPAAAISKAPQVANARAAPTVENSLVALSNFKRRPRQPSLLAMIRNPAFGPDQTLESSAIDDEDSMLDLPSEIFAPEAEGTPIHLKKAQKLYGTQQERSDVLVPATSSAEEHSTVEVRKSLLGVKRRRLLTSSPIQDSNPPVFPVTSQLESFHQETTEEGDLTVIPESPARSRSRHRPLDVDIDAIIPATQEGEPELDDEFSGIDHEANDMIINSSAVRHKQVPSEPSTQAEPMTQPSSSPPPPANPKPVKPLSTAALQSLLPKRRRVLPSRHKKKTEYDLSDSEDELTSHRPRPRNGSTTAKKPRTALTPKKNKTKANPAPKSTTKTIKTYGRPRSTVPDEANELYNVPDEGEGEDTELADVTMQDVIRSKELEDARKKFAEIDAWDMQFETVSPDDHRSSSQGWR
ncbi:hypothetical protein K470DRAFT_254040 [Piedraia hortae CBS 480.64]|uniref:Uncharacterized protein n=1 Tax=Piedraia hortae CBS 480.64 TaxID=1314780 RepID=A0A6A7CBG5_9PEZI|nr:hypothetical protein K470DRAFT_254040 [Piedraia hortae CBS 480.64]